MIIIACKETSEDNSSHLWSMENLKNCRRLSGRPRLMAWISCKKRSHPYLTPKHPVYFTPLPISRKREFTSSAFSNHVLSRFSIWFVLQINRIFRIDWKTACAICRLLTTETRVTLILYRELVWVLSMTADDWNKDLDRRLNYVTNYSWLIESWPKTTLHETSVCLENVLTVNHSYIDSRETKLRRQLFCDW
jgi:hypothetical protein